MDHMIVNCDMATVREFMFCTWPWIRMERLFLQLINKILTSLNKFPQGTTSEHWIPPPTICSPPLKFQKKFLPTNVPWNLVPSPLWNYDTYIKCNQRKRIFFFLSTFTFKISVSIHYNTLQGKNIEKKSKINL